MNLTEYIILMTAIGLLASYVAVQFRQLPRTRQAFLMLAPIPLIYLALESATAFFTIDAGFSFFGEIYDLGASSMVQYHYGGFRTSEMLLAPLVPIARYVMDSSYDVAMMLKGVHWLFGFMCILWLHSTSQPLVLGSGSSYFLLFIMTALLLPTNILALKIFNYDKLALFLGLLGIIYMVRALSDKEQSQAMKLGFIGLVVLVFAAQEKLIATPFMWLAMPVATHLFANSLLNRFPEKTGLLRRYLMASFIVVMIVNLVNALCYLELGLIRGTFNDMAPADILRPLERIIWPLLQVSIQMTLSGAILLLSISWLVAFSCALLLNKALHWQLLARLADKYRAGGLTFFYSASLIMLVTAIIWSHVGEVFLGPFYPVATGEFMPGVSFNNRFLHFAASSYADHIARLVLTDLTIFATALPSAIWLLLVLLLLLESGVIGKQISPGADRRFSAQPAAIPLLLMGLMMLAMPLLFAVTQTPAGTRYFNLFLFGFVLFLLIRFNSFLIDKKIRILALAILLPAMVFELIAYRPLYGAFVPFWYAQIERPENSKIEAGILGPINRWWGWGEEVMLAGRLIADQCEPENCASIRLHTSYAGIWLDPAYNSMGWVSVYTQQGTTVAYTENDFFIVTRASLLQETTRFPKKVPPYGTIKYGNYIQAYIYQGDVLEQHSFVF